MLRSLSAMFVVLGLLVAIPQVHAQDRIQQKAYAPEDLRRLSYDDQVRVISLEYSEQSRGRRIPDDQLRFYIDQVNRSDWGFNRIKQDIATSLGGNGDGWNPGPSPGPGGSVLCESRNNRHQECPTNFRGSAVLSENISQTRCIEGQNWGSGNGMVWVSRGCKARFVEGSFGGGGDTIRCESNDGRQRSCATPWSSRSRLVRQLSSTACVEGRNWGSERGNLWVSQGCRAEFAAAGGGNWWNPGQGNGNNYSVTCSSQNGRRNTCTWNNRYGYPALVQQLSSDSCQEGYSWGYQGNQIWVDRGCRARFGVQR